MRNLAVLLDGHAKAPQVPFGREHQRLLVQHAGVHGEPGEIVERAASGSGVDRGLVAGSTIPSCSPEETCNGAVADLDPVLGQQPDLDLTAGHTRQVLADDSALERRRDTAVAGGHEGSADPSGKGPPASAGEDSDPLRRCGLRAPRVAVRARNVDPVALPWRAD